ncbi:C-type lectin domain family 4 member E-like [Salmo trutta]|uniref:C-type lectin domain family 4 member E-like n=1 Tax=Salmo trutta TaxID=8032 RepID=UPI00112FFBAA|nr:C-type lectin domain family 4 member E-like [Salmo trutta]XP_029622275.1 C-type lectin domain family 4 member E-like [Salmo trutta]
MLFLQWWKRPSGVAAVCLGLLCVLLLAGIIGLSVYCWQKFESSWYFLSTETKTWKESREDCLERGADLVIINSDKEQEFIFNLNKGGWIGLTDSVTEGTWRWVDCTPLTNPRHWSPNQPDTGGGLAIYGEEDCVHIQQHQSPLEAWNDLSCDSKLKWICEKVL